MSEPVERTCVGRVHRILKTSGSDGESGAVIILESCHFDVLGDGSEWTPGQRVDVILRAVHEAEAPKEGE